jgi:hypothetical protein
VLADRAADSQTLTVRVTDSDGKPLDGVNLALSETEARELRDALGDLLTTQEVGWHVHVCNSDYSREVTVYREDDRTLK